MPYVQAGTQGPNLLLIHGFGASTDHWRKNIEGLCDRYRVWAIDLLGFGRSPKPKANYGADLWRDQIQAFCEQVISEPVYLAGNSIGAYVSFCVAVDHPEWVKGLILLNCAGPFAPDPNAKPPARFSMAKLTKGFLNLPGVIPVLSFFIFHQFRRRTKIRQILLKVYANPTAVTDRLVEEIYRPAFDYGALGVFSSVFRTPPGRTLDQLCETLKVPMLLLWGKQDPWMLPSKAEQIQAAYPTADLIYIDAGHCPHDDNPEAVNRALADWMGD